MSHKTVLSIILIFCGVCLGLLVLWLYLASGGSAALFMVLMAAAVTCIVAGSVLAYSRVLDRFVNPVLDEIYKDIEDDLEDLKARRLTNPFWITALTAVSGFFFSYFVFRYRMLEADWSGLPVIIPTFVGLGLLAWSLPRTPWFLDYHRPTPMWVYFIPLSGLILSLLLGIPKTQTDLMRTARPDSIQALAGQDAGNTIGNSAGFVDLLRFVDLPGCDEDICGVIMMVILLVVLTFVLVMGSAFIPHFWLFSGSILLGIMAIIALHELRLRRQETFRIHTM